MACECSGPGFCPRHQCEKSQYWWELCQTRRDYFKLWEKGVGPGQSAQDEDESPLRFGPAAEVLQRKQRRGSAAQMDSGTLSVAIVIPSHNYGRYLTECLQSVLAQSRPAAEVVVVDDRSTDDTYNVARNYAAGGVRYVRVDVGNVHQARRAGYATTRSEVLCFLDADDRLPPDYLEKGLAEFDTETVGVVYSDVKIFGEREERRTYPDLFDPDLLERQNYIHAGSLVRREAVTLSGVFDRQIDPLMSHGDWFLWRHILADGWQAKKQASTYRCRRHAGNWTLQMLREPSGYYEHAGLQQARMTLFVPLSGRRSLLDQLLSYLDRQTWPHDQISLVLMDTSQNAAFSQAVRDWIGCCDYPDVRHVCKTVATPGLADQDRRDLTVQDQVRVAVARIYNWMARNVTTPYVWVLEDDLVPPDDVCERLLRGFDPDTATVAAPYHSRYSGEPCVWNRELAAIRPRASGVETVFGNGFGCVIIRGGVLRRTVFTATGDFDRMFYQRLRRSRLYAKVDWSCAAEHRDAAGGEGTDGAPQTVPG